MRASYWLDVEKTLHKFYSINSLEDSLSGFTILNKLATHQNKAHISF